jgi:hypothetical protein
MHRSLPASAVRDRPSCRNQGLGGDLTAEYPQPILRRAEAPEQIHLQGFEVQQIQKLVESGGHTPMMACHLADADLR